MELRNWKRQPRHPYSPLSHKLFFLSLFRPRKAKRCIGCKGGSLRKVYDRGYFSYGLLFQHYKKGIHAIFRMSKSSYKPVQKFIESPQTDEIVVIYPRGELLAKSRMGKHMNPSIVAPNHFISFPRKKTVYSDPTRLQSSGQEKTAVYNAREWRSFGRERYSEAITLCSCQ